MIELTARWEELDTPEKWVEWLNLAKKIDRFLYDFWTDMEGCDECSHLDRKNVWCRLVDIPATINPYLSPRTGMSGMACMGGIIDRRPHVKDISMCNIGLKKVEILNAAKYLQEAIEKDINSLPCNNKTTKNLRDAIAEMEMFE